MIKLLTGLLCSLSFFNARSQLTKGNWLVGGSGEFYTYRYNYFSPTSPDKANYTEIDISPNIGYFLFDKIALGIRPTFSSIKGVGITPGAGNTNVQRYFIGPFGRYYFLNLEKQFNIVTDVSYQYGFLGWIIKGKSGYFFLSDGA